MLNSETILKLDNTSDEDDDLKLDKEFMDEVVNIKEEGAKEK